jgi:hypothetical protein
MAWTVAQPVFRRRLETQQSQISFVPGRETGSWRGDH